MRDSRTFRIKVELGKKVIYASYEDKGDCSMLFWDDGSVGIGKEKEHKINK